jgi:RHS repeat-associated protein
VTRLVWLKANLLKSANDGIINTKREIWEDEAKLIPSMQVFHYHNDHLGTPKELTNHNGEVVWLADYEAWGNTAKIIWREEKLESLQVSADELQPIRFQGQSFDEETGLHYNRFRYFDPDLGMFTTRDPIGLLGGNNVFQYAPNPVGWIDPFGLSECTNTRATRTAKFDEIMADLDKWALVPISGRQKRMIKDKLSTIKQRSVKANRLIRKNGFSKKQGNALIAKWEKETGQSWPSGATPHHIIPLKNGGSNEW